VVAVPTAIYPVSERFVGVSRETVPGAPVNPGNTLPVTSFTPDDKPVWLPDEALRASMAGDYDLLQGPLWTETSIGGPAYGDTIGHLFYNILGDYVQTGTAVSPSTTTTGVNAAGATSVTVASGSAFTTGMYAQVDTGSLAEIILVASGSSGSVTLNSSTPLRFTHQAGAAVTNTTAPYTSGFGLLNGGNGQPPSHTFTDRTQIPGSGNNLAVQYAYGCLSKLTLTGPANGLFTYSATMSSYSHAYPSAPPVASVSSVRAQPAWRSLVGLAGPASGGTLVNDIMEWSLDLTRVVEPMTTTDGSQKPYVFARGKFTTTFSLKFAPAIDESSLLYMLNNTQPQLQIIFSNGLSGSSLVQYTIDAQLAAFESAKLTENQALFGYDVSGRLIANTTNTSGSNVTNSGGYAPLHVSLQNAVPVY
jgi:hypothetical protein